MALWNDIIDPQTLTGYARASLADYEASKGTLARYLPNRTVLDTAVRFVKGAYGLVETANWRAYDAEPEIGKAPVGQRVSLELPAISQEIPVSEYQQLRTRNASDDAMLNSVQNTTDSVVRAIADGIEYLRGVVLATGRATINQVNFKSDDDFGRPAEHNVTAGTLWTDASVDRVADLLNWIEVYEATTGVMPGSIVMSTKVFRALTAGEGLQIATYPGSSRVPSAAEVSNLLAGYDIPAIDRFNRKVNIGGVLTSVLPDDSVYLLPAPGETTNEAGTELGGTFWGQTLTSTSSDYQIEDSEQPGLVAGVYRNEKPPMIAEVIGDAISMPVLANAALSFRAKVL